MLFLGCLLASIFDPSIIYYVVDLKRTVCPFKLIPTYNALPGIAILTNTLAILNDIGDVRYGVHTYIPIIPVDLAPKEIHML